MSGAQALLGSRLDALSALASETSSSRRRELLREVTSVFFAPTVSPEAAALFDAALEKLTDALEVELRADLAGRLATAVLAPRRLVSRLIGDPEDGVASPLLAGAVLSEADLLGALSVGGQERLRVASRRGDLTEAVCDRIVERGDDGVLEVLVSNPSAALSRAATEAVLDRAMANPALHAAVVDRESLPIDLLNEMYFVVADRLRERILARNARLDPAVLEAALGASRDRMARRAGVLPPDYDEAVEALRRAVPQGRPPAQVLMGFAREGRRTLFTAGLAQAAEVDFETVRRVLERRDFDALILVCRAAGYDAALFRSLALLFKAQDDQPLAHLMARYHELDGETARRVLRFWKVRRSGSMAA